MNPARQIWWAGLGALAEISDRTHALARQLDRWAEQGRPVAARHGARLAAAGSAAERLRDRLAHVAGEARTLFHETVEYEGRRLGARFHLASEADLRQLNARLDALAAKLDAYAATAARSPEQQPLPSSPAAAPRPAAAGS